MKKLLFVEPSEVTRKIYLSVLKPKEHDWNLRFAGSAEEALRLNETEDFDVVVSPHYLPEGNGLELFGLMKKKFPGTIRFLLIEESEKSLMRSMINDAQQVLVKPFDLPNFIKQLDRALTLRSVVHDPAILKLLGNAESLPSLPRVFQEVSKKLRDPNSALSEVGDVISEDIVLSAKVLKLVNSALFSLREPARGVNQAVSLLGNGVIGSLVFSQGMTETFSGGQATERYFEELNHHCIECATMAANILRSWNASRELVDKAVFCGIAHDLGKLILAKFAPEDWMRIQTEIKESGLPDVEVERSVIGISHCELAAYLLAVWGFPNDQVVAIAFHHEPSKIKDHQPGLLCALHLAENLTEKGSTAERFDWPYLDDCGITPDEVDTFRT